ncbi:MAG TPA: SigE family RNA polymerase sigma factor [Mycobacteriales bacterium]|nr:SigE family RNA polymerase sigma factor [Mycobacteriales bacterium]
MSGTELPFEQFVATRSQALVRFAYVLCGGDSHRAEDLVQAALTKVWRRWERIASGGQPEAYLRRVIVTEEISWRRRRASSERVTAQLPDHAGVADIADEVGAADAVWRRVAALPAGQRAVLVLRYLEDWPDAEIAAVLGCSEGTVRSQAARGLAHLRRLTVPIQRASEPTADEVRP